jgi:branched chain amino acid efflux pump
MISSDYVLLILGMGAVTYLPRWLPLHYLSRKKLPQWFVEWLQLIPAAILSALLLPELITHGEPRQLDFLQIKFFVALPTFAFAYWTRSLGGTVVVGMLLFWGAGKLPF